MKKNLGYAEKDYPLFLASYWVRLGPIVIFFSILHFFTTWYLSQDMALIASETLDIQGRQERHFFQPVLIQENREIHHIEVFADMAPKAFTYVETQVMSKEKKILYKYGQEIHNVPYKRRSKKSRHYRKEIVFPDPGVFYISIKVLGSNLPKALRILITKRRGSIGWNLMIGTALFFLAIGMGISYATRRMKDKKKRVKKNHFLENKGNRALCGFALTVVYILASFFGFTGFGNLGSGFHFL